MSARIREVGPRDLGRFEVYVNARPVSPVYPHEPRARQRAEREARTHRHVSLARIFDDRPPRTIATWVDGVEQ